MGAILSAMQRDTATLDLPFQEHEAPSFFESLRTFQWQGAPTEIGEVAVDDSNEQKWSVPTFRNEFWTARQRAAHSLHEVSYRACFKPQLPQFFVDRLTSPGDAVYDPFMGRGTTLIQAALMGRVPVGCDVNPLSRALCEPRLSPPSLDDVARTLAQVDVNDSDEWPEDLLVFFHPDTLRQICALKKYLRDKTRADALTPADRWIQMVALNRLTGHSPGFFSVYTLPPNQAVSIKAQAKINSRLAQTPPVRDVVKIILTKSRALLRDVTVAARAHLGVVTRRAQLIVGASSNTPTIGSGSIALVVTSPPFLDVVDYQTDNWLRCWFCGIDAKEIPITINKKIEDWQSFVASTLREVRRVLKSGGHVAFEVGEVRGGSVRLEDSVIPAGVTAGLEPLGVLYNSQHFTKTANCWGVTNNQKGTNTNRIVLFGKV